MFYMDEKHTPSKYAPRGFYLGQPEKAAKRYKNLKAIADKYTDGNSSKLLQMIADGYLVVVDPRERSAS